MPHQGRVEAAVAPAGRPRVLSVRTPGKSPAGASGVPPRAALAALSANSPRLARSLPGERPAEPAASPGDFDQLFSGLASDLEELASGTGARAPTPRPPWPRACPAY